MYVIVQQETEEERDGSWYSYVSKVIGPFGTAPEAYDYAHDKGMVHHVIEFMFEPEKGK